MKMRLGRFRPGREALAYGAILLVFIITGLVLYSLRTADEKGAYTSYNTRDTGVKALYLLTERMGFETLRFQKSARFLDSNGASTLVVAYPQVELLNDEMELKYLTKWIQSGNTMVLISEEGMEGEYRILRGMKVFSDGKEERQAGGNYSLKAGKGSLVFLVDGWNYLNDKLRDGGSAPVFIESLDKAGNKKVLFNEYYHGIADNQSILLEIIGPTGRLLVLQGITALLVLFLVLSRRFGKPLTVFEIVKRRENENLYALSNLYKRSRANHIVLEIHLRHFKEELGKFLGFGGVPGEEGLIAASEKTGYLKDKNIREIIIACRSYIEHQEKDQTRMLKLIGRLEEIRRGIKS